MNYLGVGRGGWGSLQFPIILRSINRNYCNTFDTKGFEYCFSNNILINRFAYLLDQQHDLYQNWDVSDTCT